MKKPKQPALLPEVNFSEHGGIRYLHLGGTEWVQGSMRQSDPIAIDLEYVQRMMAWLLFVPVESLNSPGWLAERHAMQMGLGSAALTKFCHKRLGMRTTAIELNPQVIVACRLWFKLPADDATLSVLAGDAAEAARDPQWQASVDALQVDLYDQEAAAPVLDTSEFYTDCRGLLTGEGTLAVNLFGRNASFERSLEKIVSAFGAEQVWAFRPTREGNTIVLARRGGERPGRADLVERADLVQGRWGLPAAKWLKSLRPLA